MLHSEENNFFDDPIRDKLEDASLTPPPGIWDKIEEDLPPALPFILKFKHPVVAAALTFILISSVFIYQKFEYAYQLQKFVAKTLQVNETLPNDGDIRIYGLNITALAEFGKTKEYQQNKSHYAKRVTPIVNTPTEQTSFTGPNYTYATQENKENRTNTSQHTGHSLSAEETISSSTTLTLVQNNALTNSNSTKKINKELKKVNKSKAEKAKSSAQVSEQDIPNAVSAKEEITNFSPISEKVLELAMIEHCSLQDDENLPIANVGTQKKVYKKKSLQRNKGLFIGPLTGAHYTAMTLSSPEGVNTSKMDQSATFGTFYGISAGYIIDSRWSVGIEWIYNSSEGQRFEGVFKGKTSKKYVDLDYFKIPVYVKFRHQFVQHQKKVRTSLNYLAGLHYSKLKNTNTFVNGEVEAFKINTNTHQWGMLLGAELDIYPTDRIFFTLGMRGTFNADVANLPTLRGDKNTDAFSVQTGVYAKMHYVFTRKTK